MKACKFSLVVFFALHLASPAFAQQADAVQKYMAEHRDQIVASGELLMSLGACETHIPKETTDFYIAEYATTDADADDFVSHGLADFHQRQFKRGQAEAADLGFSTEMCRKLVAGAIEDLRLAMKTKP